MAALLTAGQRHESAFFTDLMDRVRVPRPTGRPKKRPEVVLEAKHRVGDSGPKRDAHWARETPDL
jgi:hypothetical protein